MSNGVGITLIAVGAILRFALAGGSPHGLNVHVVGVVLILAGVIELLMSLLVVRGGPRRLRSLVRKGRGGYYDLPGPNAQLQRTRQAAAEDVAEVLGGPPVLRPGRRDARKTIFKPASGVPSPESRKTGNVKVLLRTTAAAPARNPRTQWQGPEFLYVRTDWCGKTSLLKHHENSGEPSVIDMQLRMKAGHHEYPQEDRA
jgi:hypothetical protein